jgi:hypothetical protein
MVTLKNGTAVSENAAETAAKLIGFVQAIMPAGLDPHRADWERYLSGERYGTAYLTFNRTSSKGERVEVDVEIGFENDWNHEEAEDGSIWSSMSVKAGVNWASHGSASPDLALERLALMTEGAQLAKAIVDEFTGKVWICRHTAEEVARNRAEQDARVIRIAVEKVVGSVLKGMRVGNTRFTATMPPGVPRGTYDVVVQGRRFRADVTKAAVLVERLADAAVAS